MRLNLSDKKSEYKFKNVSIIIFIVLIAILLNTPGLSSGAYAAASTSKQAAVSMPAASSVTAVIIEQPSTQEAAVSSDLTAEDLDIIKKIQEQEQAKKEIETQKEQNLFSGENCNSNKKVTTQAPAQDITVISNAAQSAAAETGEVKTKKRAYKPRAPYKPLEITGEKIFILNDVSVKGNFSKFAGENYDTYPGFKYSSELRLNIEGNIAENIRVSAHLDDTNVSQETKKLTLYIDGRVWNFTLGDFTTSYTDTEYTLYNKKLKGIEATGNIEDGKYQVKAIASRSEGISYSEVFTGAGMQSEYQLTYRPIVQNSETVKLDGNTLRRGTDYTIDYEDGSIILKAHILPLETRNRISVDYEYFENGKMYRRTLVALRGTAELKNLNKAGITVIREEDDKGAAEGTDQNAVAVKPTATTIIGLDYKLNPIEKLKLDGEFAVSLVDPNTLGHQPGESNIDGFARYFKIDYKEKKYSLMLRNEMMGDDFVSIGKNRLDINDNKNEASLKLTPIDPLSLQFDIEDGTKTSINDPDLPSSTQSKVKIDSKAFRSFTGYKLSQNLNLNLNTSERLKESDMSRLHFHETTWQSEVTNVHNKITERARYNVRNLIYKYDPTAKQTEKTYNAGWIFNKYEKLNCALEYSKIKTEGGAESLPMSNIDNISLDITSNLTKKLSLNTVLLTRVEDNMQTNRTDNLITTDTKIRYNPSNKVQTQIRYKEMQSKKFLLNKTYNEQVLSKKEGETSDDNYIKVEEPVTTQTGSFLVDLMPFNKIRSQLQYQFKNLINLNTKARMAVSDSSMAEFKYAPNNTLSTIYRLMNSKNTQSVGTLLANRDLNHNFETRKSLNSKMALISNLELDYKTDSYQPSESADTFAKTVKLEKDLSAALNVSMGLSHSEIKRNAPYKDSGKISILSGFRIIPKAYKMTLRGNIDHSIEDDSITQKKKTVLETLLDYDLGGETEVSANYKFINTAKTELEDGYKARVGKVTLTKRF
ncbi:MAG: hypothetical protein QMC67_08520 [Candidatus Wallbacteria bacterium]